MTDIIAGLLPLARDGLDIISVAPPSRPIISVLSSSACGAARPGPPGNAGCWQSCAIKCPWEALHEMLERYMNHSTANLPVAGVAALRRFNLSGIPARQWRQ